MNLSNILSVFSQAVPVWDVAVLICLVIIFRDLKHLKELLSNHVTDTNKKIDELKMDTAKKIDELKIDTAKRLDKFEDSVKTELKEIKNKLDKLLSGKT